MMTTTRRAQAAPAATWAVNTVAIQCRLKPAYPGSDTEECALTVLAETPDGHRKAWVGYNWLDTTTRRAAKDAERKNGTIHLYDRTLLELIPKLMQPLHPRPSGYGNEMMVRLTRKPTTDERIAATRRSHCK